MQIEVPYLTQDAAHTCGPTVLTMVANYFGNEVSLDTVVSLVNTCEEDGTSNADLLKAVRQLGLKAQAKEGASLEDIKVALVQGYPVVVNYIELEGVKPIVDVVSEDSEVEGHFALVTGITSKEIILNDPLYGRNYAIGLKQFESRWKSGFEDCKRWMMVVSPKLSLYQHFNSLLKSPLEMLSKFRS